MSSKEKTGIRDEKILEFKFRIARTYFQFIIDIDKHTCRGWKWWLGIWSH